jgi:hypothetical protein
MGILGPNGWQPLGCGRNHCPGCFRRKRWQLVTALFHDATTELPDLVLTLTTVDPAHSFDSTPIKRGTERIIERLRHLYGDQVAYMAPVEFTTGKGTRSGGHRRLHLHPLVKVRCAYDLAVVDREVRRIWHRYTGASVVEVAPLQSSGGIIGYLGGLHHTKRSQRPPAEWTGRTVRASRNYWADGRETTYAIARQEQLHRRLLWIARDRLGPDAPAELVELELGELMLAAANHQWHVAPVRHLIDANGELVTERRDVGGPDLRAHRRALSERGPRVEA